MVGVEKPNVRIMELVMNELIYRRKVVFMWVTINWMFYVQSKREWTVHGLHMLILNCMNLFRILKIIELKRLRNCWTSCDYEALSKIYVQRNLHVPNIEARLE